MPHQSINAQLLAAEVAINNALDDTQVLSALKEFGYDEGKLMQGKALWKTAQHLNNSQRMEYGAQHEAAHNLDEAKTRAQDAYSLTLKVARVAFKNNQRAQTGLGLNGRRKQATSEWLDQTRLFYENLLEAPEFIEAMSEFGYTQDKLAAELERVEEVDKANRMQEQEKGDAQQSTQARDEALSALHHWMTDFKQIAEVALADVPQQLEKLGFGPIKRTRNRSEVAEAVLEKIESQSL